jgi:hypothetical protein
MCTSTILDPANLAGKRKGGINIAGAMDPGGAIIKATTGSNIGRNIADPGKFLKPYDSEQLAIDNQPAPINENMFIRQPFKPQKRAKKLYGETKSGPLF